MLFGLFKSSSASLHGPTIIQTTTTTDPATSHVCISCTLYASNDYFSLSLLVVREKMRSIFGMVYVSFVAFLLLASLTQRRFDRKLDWM